MNHSDSFLSAYFLQEACIYIKKMEWSKNEKSIIWTYRHSWNVSIYGVFWSVFFCIGLNMDIYSINSVLSQNTEKYGPSCRTTFTQHVLSLLGTRGISIHVRNHMQFNSFSLKTALVKIIQIFLLLLWILRKKLNSIFRS